MALTYRLRKPFSYGIVTAGWRLGEQYYRVVVSHNLPSDQVDPITFAFDEGVPGWSLAALPLLWSGSSTSTAARRATAAGKYYGRFRWCTHAGRKTATTSWYNLGWLRTGSDSKSRDCSQSWGVLSVRSTLSEGALFTVTLPIHSA